MLASSRLSFTPIAACIGWFGIHSHPPERAVVPPKSGAFSATITSRPSLRAVTAAASPPAPEPAMRTSHSMARDDTQPFVRIGAMNNTVVRNIRRADAAAIEALERLGVATVHEAQGRTGLMAPYMRPLWRGARIAGSAVTALCAPGDNWMIHVAAEVLKPGDVLVVACMSENTDGAFGELLATSLKARGAKGIVIDMGCRDAAEISEMRFPVWSRAVSARGTVKATLGSVNVPVVVAGLQVTPGDVVVADDDGVVLVSRLQAGEVARLGQEREKKEAATRARLQKGELGLDIYGMRKALEEKGLKYIDEMGSEQLSGRKE